MKLQYILVISLTIKVVFSETEPLAPCDTCCRGPSGNHGLNGEHGLPGRDGLAGLDGMKGERGSDGEPGLPGVRGNRGRNGEPGANGWNGEAGYPGQDGLPGSKGNQGKPGFNGMDGLPGRKGDSGSSQRRSAFTVVRSAPQTSAVVREAVNFNRSLINEGGHFDLERDRFTCSIPGVYVFNFQAVTDSVDGGNYMELVLLKNEEVVTIAATGLAKSMAAGSAILSLREGDKVRVTLDDVGEVIYCDEFNQCLFSGFLLYEN